MMRHLRHALAHQVTKKHRGRGGLPLFFNRKIGGILNHQKGAFMNESFQPKLVTLRRLVFAPSASSAVQVSSSPFALLFAAAIPQLGILLNAEGQELLFDNARSIVYTLDVRAMSE